jgi:homoserine kinase
MLISEISKEHKSELDKLDREYQIKFQEQANNERILKENQDLITKCAEETQRELTNETGGRLPSKHQKPRGRGLT